MSSSVLAPRVSAGANVGSTAAGVVVSDPDGDGAPDLQFQMQTSAGAQRTIDVEASTGSTVVDPEVTPLTRGGEVLTWIEAYSHGLSAHYAVLNANGRVIAEAAYGAGYSSDFQAIALPGGGFALADAETDLFGLHGSIAVQSFSARGASTHAPVTVISETGSGLHYSDLQGQSIAAGLELSWTEPSGAHTALVEPNGTVIEPFSLLGQAHAGVLA